MLHYPGSNLDTSKKSSVKELHTTLDGKHWNLDDTRRTTRRSKPPAGPSSTGGVDRSRAPSETRPTDGVDHSRAPSKTRPSSPVIDSIPPRILFPTANSPSPSPSTSSVPDRIDSRDNSPDDGGSTVFVQPPPASGHSFLDDFVPRGISGSDLLAGSSAVLAGSSAVLHSTTSALNSTASAVRQMFSSSSERPAGTRPALDPDDTPRVRTNRDAAPPPAPPTPQQFAELQLRYAALQRRVDDLASRQTAEQRVRAIEDDIEQRRKAAYEAANIPYSPRHDRPRSPTGSSLSLSHGPRGVEYRIAHKSIGYLRPADASHRPFEAIEGEVYVRPLAWLAHLRTKLELKEDFHYKNQVLQVASECLMGRAAAWWTAIGQRMRNILLTDYTLDLWHQQMQVLCQSREQTRKIARDRSWRVDKEECWDYVWEKAALFEELEPRDRPSGVALIAEILDGLPSSLARMSRTEFSPNPTVADLTRELQILVPRWRRDSTREIRDFAPREKDLLSRHFESSHRHRERSRRPPTRPLESSERTPLSISYDKSKISLQPHPITRKLTRCFTKPNGSTIFLSRNCSRCQEAHFDFEHDALRSPASAQLVLDEAGYEMWDWESDSGTIDEDTAAKKLN